MSNKQSLWDKIKDLFVDDIDEETPDTPKQPTQPTQLADKKQPASEDVAEEKPKPSPSAPKKKNTKIASSNNYIENKNQATQLITTCLSKYADSTDKDLAVLELWVIRDPNSPIVPWADEAFLNDLRKELHQERIIGIKKIKLYLPTYEEFLELKKQRPEIMPIERTRLYYHTHSAGKSGPVSVKGQTAWLSCIQGQNNLQQDTFELNPGQKKQWLIGRGSNGKPMAVPNDIVINPDCRNVSSTQATIIYDDGQYWLACRKGGCRNLGGTVTKIIRTDGTEQELLTLSPKLLPPLKEGDVIMLARTIYLRFSYKKPE